MNLLADSGAIYSHCRLYRYRLWRHWELRRPRMAFVMLNPSTADEITNDPTVERCQRRAERMGFGSIEVVNIFAYRSTDPRALYKIDDPIGPKNDEAIQSAVFSASMVICAWGAHGALRGRGAAVVELLRSAGVKPHALRLNADGSPAHPLYLGYDVEPFPLSL